MKVDALEFIADPGCSYTQNSSTCVHSTTHLPLNSFALFKYLTNHRLLQYLFYKVHVKTSSGALLRQLWLCGVGTTQSLRSAASCSCLWTREEVKAKLQPALKTEQWTLWNNLFHAQRASDCKDVPLDLKATQPSIDRFFQFLTEKSRKKY